MPAQRVEMHVSIVCLAWRSKTASATATLMDQPFDDGAVTDSSVVGERL